MFPDDNANIFAVNIVNIVLQLLQSLILSSIIVRISFYILSKRFFLKREGLSDARVASITKKNMI